MMTLQQILDDINHKASRPYVLSAPKSVKDIPISLIAYKKPAGGGTFAPFRINGVQEYQVQVYTSFKEPYHKVKVNVMEIGDGGEAHITGKSLDEQLEPVLNPPQQEPTFQQKMQAVKDQLITSGQAMAIVDKKISDIGRSAIVEAVVRNPRLPNPIEAGEKRVYLIEYVVSEHPDTGVIEYEPYGDENQATADAVRAIRVELGQV